MSVVGLVAKVGATPQKRRPWYAGRATSEGFEATTSANGPGFLYNHPHPSPASLLALSPSHAGLDIYLYRHTSPLLRCHLQHRLPPTTAPSLLQASPSAFTLTFTSTLAVVSLFTNCTLTLACTSQHRVPSCPLSSQLALGIEPR